MEDKKCPSETNKCPFDKEELKRAIESGNVCHSLNYDNLRKAAQIIFGDNDRITEEFYQQTIIRGNYIGFNLERHGFPNLLGDLKLLTNYLRTAIHIVTQTTKQRSKKVFSMGCGPGRLAIPTIELAKKFNLEEIVFNDLLPEHIDATREKIAKCYGTRSQHIDGVKINFETGDFTKVAENIRKKFDVLFAMWFVTSEICDFNSVEAVKEKRKTLYHWIKRLLTKQGVFIEDIPFSEGVGTYYYLARLKTYAILHDMGILEGENDHMLLTDFTDIQDTGFPYHIRYVPSNGKHRKELENSWFREHISSVSVLPSAIRNPQKYEDEFGTDQKLQSLFEGNTIDAIIRFLTQKEYEFLTFPNPTDPEAKQKKTIMWRQDHTKN